MSSSPPLPHNPRRMAWGEVPRAVVAAIEAQAGSLVASAEGSPVGFSPGFAGIVTFADGSRLFLKVMSSVRDPWSIHLNRREAEVLAILPNGVPAASLAWVLEHDEWFVLATEAVEGEHPRVGEEPSHASELWEVLTKLAQQSAPEGLLPFHEYLSDVFDRWQRLVDLPDRDARIANFGEDAGWIAAHLDELVAWEHEGIEASKGDALVHGDFRADNVLLGGGHTVIVDWPHAVRGAPWMDLIGYMPSYEVHGGGSASEAFRAHPLSNGISPEQERGLIAGLAGYFTVQSTEPPVPALPGLREFQRAHAAPSLRWLRQLAD